MSRTTSTLAEVPKIVITETSPAPIEAAAARVPVEISRPSPQIYTEPAAETAITTIPEKPLEYTGNSMSVRNKAAVVTSGEFKPAVDSQECTVNVVVDSSNPILVSEVTNNELSDDLGRQTCWDIGSERCLKWVCDFKESKYMIPLLVLLLFIPISAGYMGGVCLNKCPMSAATPVLLFMMGITGCIVIICHLVLLVQNLFVLERYDTRVLSTIFIYGYVTIVLFLCTEMVSFLGRSPSFRPTDSNYCDETFYKYTYWLNWWGLIFILAMIVHFAPKKCARRTAL